MESFLDSDQILDKNFQIFQFKNMTGGDQLARVLTKTDLRTSMDL